MNSADSLSSIPFDDFGGKGKFLHFAHANGYPPRAYEPLLSKFTKDYHVIAMHSRPLWQNSDPHDIEDWKQLSIDLMNFLDQRKIDTTVGIGHSMGATASLRLAIRHPKRFSKLILIDPVLFPPWMIFLWNLIRRLGLSERYHPLISSTRRRRNRFNDIQEIYKKYRRKSVFRYFDDQALSIYVRAISTTEIDGTTSLSYPRLWEARLYETAITIDMDIWRALHELKQPILLIRGVETDTFWGVTAERFIDKAPQTQLVTIPNSTHLVPLERPGLVSEAILSFLKQ